MEQENFNENSLGNLDKKELMTSIQGRLAKQIKYNRFYAVFWLAVFLAVAVMAFNGNVKYKDWIYVFLPLAVGLECLFMVLWYGKMTRCGDAKQLLKLFNKGAIWNYVIGGLAAGLLGYTLGFYIYDLGEWFSGILYGVAIVLFVFAAFIVISSEYRIRSLKNNEIKDLRELEAI